MDGNVRLQNISGKPDNEQHNPAFTLETDPTGPPPYDQGLPNGSTSNNSSGGKSPQLNRTVDSIEETRSDSSVIDTVVNITSEKPSTNTSSYIRDSTIDEKSDYSGVRYEDTYIDESGMTLIYSKHEKVPLKDFSNEVRASMDVEQYLKNCVMILDMNENSLDEIVSKLLHKMLDHWDNTKAFDQAKSALFTHDSIHQLSRTLQCTSISEGGGFDYEQNWVCAMCNIPSVNQRYVGIARLHSPANMGMTCQEVYFVTIILAPTKAKGTKNEFETGRTFATIFSDPEFRLKMLSATTEEECKHFMEEHTRHLSDIQKKSDEKFPVFDDEEKKCKFAFMRGLRDDLKRRLPHYISDYKDGIVGPKSLQKTISTTFFLYFSIILPSIAFGVLNAGNTTNILNVEKVIYSQLFGGLVFALIGGTPQIVLLTTAPLALYTKIIYTISSDFDLNFKAMFTCVGLWNSFFLFLFSFFDLSFIMQFSTRSSEEIFALFISIAFSVDAFKDTALNFNKFYNSPACQSVSSNISASVTTTVASSSPMPDNITSDIFEAAEDICHRDVSLLYLLLLLGTLWIGVLLFNFNTTPYLNAGKRELLADYALAVSVVVMTFIGAYLFRDVNLGKSFDPERQSGLFELVSVQELPVAAVFGAMGLGFCLSLLFFMDQNISAALVNAPQNKMKKGTAYHWDLFVIGIINGLLSLICFPWVHAALPHSPLHVRALADVEERVDQGHIYQIIVRVRETRLTAILSHILIGCSLFILHILAYIPTPVLYGLFLYVAVTALYDNQMFERMALLVTEQSAYPPNHYIRRVPQRKMHLFTFLQMIQLLVLCGFGFAPYPYLKMFFPVLIFFLIPLRRKLIPCIIEQKFLNAMDSH